MADDNTRSDRRGVDDRDDRDRVRRGGANRDDRERDYPQDRAGKEDRGDHRDDRERGDRLDRGDRGDRGGDRDYPQDRAGRDDRGAGGRGSKEEGSYGRREGENPRRRDDFRDDRGGADRSDRGERVDRMDRGDREHRDRDRGDRDPRDRTDRGDVRDRPRGDYGDRGERQERGDSGYTESDRRRTKSQRRANPSFTDSGATPIAPANFPADVLASDVIPAFGGSLYGGGAGEIKNAPMFEPTAEDEDFDADWERSFKAKAMGAQIGKTKAEDAGEDDADGGKKRKRSKWDEGGKSDLPDWLRDEPGSSSRDELGRPGFPRAGGPTFKQIRLPAKQKGGLIGKGGDNINWIRKTSGADVKVKYTPGDDHFYVQITGNVEYVEDLIRQKLEESSKDWMTKIIEDIPQDLISQTIGSGGKHLKDIGTSTGCRLDFLKSEELWPDRHGLKVCRIRGPPKAVETADQLLRLKVVEVQRLERLKKQGKLTGGVKAGGTGRLNIPTYRDVMDSAAQTGSLDKEKIKTGLELAESLAKSGGKGDWEDGFVPDNLYANYGAEDLLPGALPPPPPPGPPALTDGSLPPAPPAPPPQPEFGNSSGSSQAFFGGGGGCPSGDFAWGGGGGSSDVFEVGQGQVIGGDVSLGQVIGGGGGDSVVGGGCCAISNGAGDFGNGAGGCCDFGKGDFGKGGFGKGGCGKGDFGKGGFGKGGFGKDSFGKGSGCFGKGGGMGPRQGGCCGGGCFGNGSPTNVPSFLPPGPPGPPGGGGGCWNDGFTKGGPGGCGPWNDGGGFGGGKGMPMMNGSW